MANSVFLARLIGPVLLVVGIALFLNRNAFRAMAEEFLKSRALIYLSGLLSMTGGLAVVLVHNLWVADWPVLITVLGWLATIGGALRILIPDKVEDWGRTMIRNPMTMNIAGGIWLAAGVLFCFFGYVR